MIRLVVPELTEERRRDIAKSIHKKGEEAKIAIRSIRRDANESFKKAKKASEVTEDDFNILEEEVQKLTNDFTKMIDELVKEKEQEIMAV